MCILLQTYKPLSAGVAVEVSLNANLSLSVLIVGYGLSGCFWYSGEDIFFFFSWHIHTTEYSSKVFTKKILLTAHVLLGTTFFLLIYCFSAISLKSLSLTKQNLSCNFLSLLF